MGESQSKSQNNGSAEQSSQERLLQQQKRFYEQRLIEAQRTQAENARELARKAEEKKLDELLRQQVQAAERALAQQQINSGSEFSSPETLERHRSPYNLTPNELQRNTQRTTTQNASPTIYPSLNLNPFASNSSSSHAFREQRVESFEFINSNFQSPGTSHSSNVSPSAPPENLLDSGIQSRGPNKQNQKNKPSSRPADCSTCGQPYGMGKIFQCAGDNRNIRHSSCANCKADNKKCGICKAGISDMRNLGLETKLADLKVPCPNNCDRQRLWNTVGTVDTIDEHKKECPMRMLPCPVLGPSQCSWRGKFNNLSAHVKDAHPESCQSVDTEINIDRQKIDNPSHTKAFIELDAFKFLAHTKVDTVNRKIFMAVQQYSSRNDNTWYYEIHVFNKREPRRKFLYTDVVQPSFTPIQDIFGQSKCVSIPTPYATTFFNQGSLTYKIYIKSNFYQAEPSNSRWKGRRDNRATATS